MSALEYETEEHTEETYENMRFYPVKGWSTSLLPTDPFAWSSADGLEEIEKDSVTLPGAGNWEWQTEWAVDRSKNPEDDGWEYAPDFKNPAAWHCENRGGMLTKNKDFARRRRWTRVRSHQKVNSAQTLEGVKSAKERREARRAAARERTRGREGRREGKKDYSKMTMQEAEQIKDDAFEDNQRALDNTLKALADSEAIATDTAMKIDAQKEQLRTVNNDLDSMDTSLSTSQKIIKSMQGWSMFSSKKKVAKQKEAEIQKKAALKAKEDAKAAKSQSSGGGGGGGGGSTVASPEDMRLRLDIEMDGGMEMSKLNNLLGMSWKKYYCVLSRKGQYLQCFGGRDDLGNVVDKVSLVDAKVVVVEGGKYDKSHIIQINDTHVFACPSLPNLKEWMSALNQQCRVAKRMASRNEEFKEMDADAVRFEAEFDKAKAKEDEKIDIIGQHLDRLKEQSEQIGRGLAETGDLIDQADNKVDNNQAKIEENTKETGKILKKKSWW